MSPPRKDLTLLRGSKSRIYITEGVLDALAIKRIDPEAYFIVLNGTGQAQRAADFIKEKVPQGWEVVLALDNDRGGQEAEQKITKILAKTGLEVKKLRYKGDDPSKGWRLFGKDFVEGIERLVRGVPQNVLDDLDPFKDLREVLNPLGLFPKPPKPW